ncbi:N-acetylmuramidase domain-containing protein [Ahrensia sp. R2A130]|uniref:N-acetylmuramidase domain-containing protein n=1 Tax=Ahrensia sp. R2A130 TaxID=744979 RepID=UPI0001E0BC87|nr:N-acetylmuramidase domain-containing protein [Ahrensia sp. R2A130]EFL88744.1 peptidoglycan binding domain-containing protein [Ahrensia sp. R2A130]
MFDDATIIAISEIAERLNCHPAALLAVVEVESGGRTGATVRGRFQPLIRFEGHYFDRFLKGDVLETARLAGLADRKAGAIKNPRSQSARWDMLDRAISIDRTAALSSCSWGMGQVMGSHWQWLGYGSVDALVAEARSGIAGQVELMVRYIERAKISDALRTCDWHRFARIYNGPAYAKHGYHTRMAAAHRRWMRKLATADTAERDVLKFGDRGPRVKQLQDQLKNAGYMVVSDGIFGLDTDKELRNFQRDNGFAISGMVGHAEWAKLGGSTAIAAVVKQALPKVKVPRWWTSASQRLANLLSKARAIT